MKTDRLSNHLRIRVKNSGVVRVGSFNDYPDGNLFIIESGKSIPFEIKRLYYINDLGSSKALRGKHAHKKLEQIAFCINGSFSIQLDDGITKQNILLDDPSYGIRIRPKLWITMSDFSKDCVLLVLANDFFDESDYIRHYGEFLKYIKVGK